MSMAGKLAVIASFIISTSVQPGWQQQCSVERLPDFRDTGNRDSPDDDRFQAIVPAYRFNCSGRVTEWGACVQPGGNSSEQYYIQFQVWRSTGIEGCYELVGSNIPLDDATEEERNISDSGSIIEREGFLSPLVNSGDGLNCCVILPVRENKQIEFMAGDVVGYYVDHFQNYFDKNTDGIQWIEDSGVEVHYRHGLPREDIKSQYALNGPSPTECFQVSDEAIDLHTLGITFTSAPIISVSIAIMMTPVFSLSPSPQPGQVVASSTPPLAPSHSATMTPGTSCADSLDSMCSNTQDDTANNTNRNIPIIGGIGGLVSLLAIVVATIVAISVLLWLRKRRRPELVDNVAYLLAQNRQLDSNPVYHTVSAANVVMDTNESYAANSVPTFPNTAYQAFQPPSRKSVDIATATNEAYMTTDIVNTAYQPTHSSSEHTHQLEYDYVRSDNNLECD